jgi:hypothetical protein
MHTYIVPGKPQQTSKASTVGCAMKLLNERTSPFLSQEILQGCVVHGPRAKALILVH